MPTKGTPVRTLRVPSELWEKAKAKAQREGTTIGAVLVAALEKFVAP